MDKVLPTIIVLVVLALVFTGLALGWRARRRSQAGLGAATPPPSELGDVTLQEDLFYVATTHAERPLERITAAGLGFRARTVVTVASTGVLFDLTGTAPVFIPRDDLVAAGRASWTIDKAFKTDGLVALTWRLGDTEVDSYLRSADPAALLSALTALLPTASTPDPQRSDS